MTEDFVDVTWRGLEVVKQARLRGTGARSAYLEHATPMPTGSQLTLRTADGPELAAVVARVQEQIGGRTEPPGMELTIEASGAAASWWLVRVEAHAASLDEAAVAQATAAQSARIRASARETISMSIAAIPHSEPPVMPVAPIETAPTRPSSRATAVTIPPPIHVPIGHPPRIVDDGRRTDLMISVDAIEAAEAGDAIPTGIDDSVDPPGDGILDDGRRTMIMPAVDIAAIVEAGARPDPDPTDDGGDKRAKAKGKRRRGR